MHSVLTVFEFYIDSNIRMCWKTSLALCMCCMFFSFCFCTKIENLITLNELIEPLTRIDDSFILDECSPQLQTIFIWHMNMPKNPTKKAFHYSNPYHLKYALLWHFICLSLGALFRFSFKLSGNRSWKLFKSFDRFLCYAFNQFFKKNFQKKCRNEILRVIKR